MAYTARDAFDEIIAFIKEHGDNLNSWYCGITDNVERRLFNEHYVSRDGLYNSCDCLNDLDARAVEKRLIELGCRGDTGGGDDDSIYVYVYKIGLTTIQ